LIQKIDYWHRDKNGKPTLLKDHDQEKDYKTANGRIVHNLGGVVPDVVISDKIQNSLIKNMINKNYLFDFVTHYYYTHTKPENIDQMKIDDAVVEKLISYLKKNNLQPKSTAQIILENSKKKAEKEGNKEVLSAYDDLLKIYQQQNFEIIRQNKELIKKIIAEDLAQRYFYIDGLTQYKLKYDQTVLKAMDILNHPKEYNKILNKK